MSVTIANMLNICYVGSINQCSFDLILNGQWADNMLQLVLMTVEVFCFEAHNLAYIGQHGFRARLLMKEMYICHLSCHLFRLSLNICIHSGKSGYKHYASSRAMCFWFPRQTRNLRFCDAEFTILRHNFFFRTRNQRDS